MDDLPVVASAYDKIARIELSYRRMVEDPSLSLKDSFETALCISTRGMVGQGDFAALQNGISRLRYMKPKHCRRVPVAKNNRPAADICALLFEIPYIFL